MPRLFRVTGIIILIPVIILVMIILYASISDFNPAEEENITSGIGSSDTLSVEGTYHIVTWNIGYAGLDKNMDFFYDGGRKVRTDQSQLKKNFTEIRQYLLGADSVDFILFQEVDRKSKRSYRQDQVETLCQSFDNYNCFYGKNYDVFFVPLPPATPMGSVNSGLLSLARYDPSEVKRYAFPGQYAWPKRLFMLDRCFMVMRYPLTNGKEFLIVNTHNEAYDSGAIRDQQMAYLREFLFSEYEKGNYILTGGDWNQCPPDFHPEFNGQVFDNLDLKEIEPDFLPEEWTWVFDRTVPSNRRVDIIYEKGLTRTTVIDFFLLSPNLVSLGCKTIDLGFTNSDHQPVMIQVKLKTI